MSAPKPPLIHTPRILRSRFQIVFHNILQSIAKSNFNFVFVFHFLFIICILNICLCVALFLLACAFVYVCTYVYTCVTLLLKNCSWKYIFILTGYYLFITIKICRHFLLICIATTFGNKIRITAQQSIMKFYNCNSNNSFLTRAKILFTRFVYLPPADCRCIFTLHRTRGGNLVWNARCVFRKVIFENK